MTQNQIAYHNAKELERHNVAAEAETVRHQKQDEAIRKRSNELSHESNIITQEHYERMDAINARHYENQDAYNQAMLAETQRSNQVNEMIRAQQNAINSQSVNETIRHQLTMDALNAKLASNTIYKTQAEVSAMSPNADYTRARTAQMWNEWGMTGLKQQEQVTQNEYLRRNLEANLQNVRARTGTEKTRAYVNIAQGTETWSSMILSWLKALGVTFR